MKLGTFTFLRLAELIVPFVDFRFRNGHDALGKRFESLERLLRGIEFWGGRHALTVSSILTNLNLLIQGE